MTLSSQQHKQTKSRPITGSVGLLLAAGCVSHLHFFCCARERPPQGTMTSMMANRSDFCESLGRGSWDCWSKLPPKTKKKNRESKQSASICVRLYSGQLVLLLLLMLPPRRLLRQNKNLIFTTEKLRARVSFFAPTTEWINFRRRGQNFDFFP